MATTEILAADMVVSVNDGGGYDVIGGLTKLTMSYGGSSKKDVTDFDDAGQAAHKVTKRVTTIKLEGNYLEDESTGARDAGQASVEALAKLVGSAAACTLKIVSPGGVTREWNGTFDMGDIGGGVEETLSWSAEFTRCGADI